MKTDRRIERTQKQLQNALVDLINDYKYDAITVQMIVDYADVGRTTFYEHFDGKDDLFMSCHTAVVSKFYQLHAIPDIVLSSEAPPAMIDAYRYLLEFKPLLYPIFQSPDGLLILRRIRQRSAKDIETSLRAKFDKSDSMVPLNLLANYLAGAQISLVEWWLQNHQPHTPEILAKSFHRLQCAAIRDAFGLKDGME